LLAFVAKCVNFFLSEALNDLILNTESSLLQAFSFHSLRFNIVGYADVQQAHEIIPEILDTVDDEDCVMELQY
jgi:hypothetical protein